MLKVDTLFGDENVNEHAIGQIFEILQTKAKAVFTEEINSSLSDFMMLSR